MNTDIRPRMVAGLPRCDESCPSHDGKRCRILGHRPDAFCEPALKLGYKSPEAEGDRGRAADLLEKLQGYEAELTEEVLRSAYGSDFETILAVFEEIRADERKQIRKSIR